MAGKVFFSVPMSLDGFMAPEAVPVEDVYSPEGQNDPRVQRWMTQWMELQQWIFPQRFFRENLKLGEGGEEGLDNDIARATHERTPALFRPAVLAEHQGRGGGQGNHTAAQSGRRSRTPGSSRCRPRCGRLGRWRPRGPGRARTRWRR